MKEYKRPESMQQAIDNYRNYSDICKRLDNVNYALAHIKDIRLTEKEREGLQSQLENLRSGLLDEESGEYLQRTGVDVLSGAPNQAEGLEIMNTLESLLKKS